MWPVEVTVDDEHGVALRRVAAGPLQTNCWIVYAVGHTEALLVDPGADAEAMTAAADLNVAAIVLTNAHFGHVMAVPKTSQALGVPRWRRGRGPRTRAIARPGRGRC